MGISDNKRKKLRVNKKSWFEKIKSSLKSRINIQLKNNYINSNLSPNEKEIIDLEVNQKFLEIEVIKNNFQSEKELLKTLAENSIQKIKDSYSNKYNDMKLKIESLNLEYKSLKKERYDELARHEMQISDKNNLIEELKIKNNNQLAANDKKVKEQFDLLQTYKQKISKKEKELIKYKDLNKLLDNDLNKLTQEKNLNERKILNELDLLKNQLKNIKLVNNDLISENQDLNNKLILKEKEINKKLINVPNIANISSSETLSELYNFEKWMQMNTTLSQSSINKYANSVSNMRLDLIRMKNIDIFNSKNNNKENLENLLNIWLIENLEKDKKGNNMYSSGFRKFIIFKSLNDVLDIKQKLIPQEEKNKYKQTQIDNDIEIDQLNFTIRVYHSLMRNGCRRLSDIKNLTDLEILGMKDMGESGLLEIKSTLRRYENSSHVLFNQTEKNNINLSKSNKNQIINLVKANSNIKHNHNKFLKIFNQINICELIKNSDNKNFNELINEIKTKVNKISEFNLTNDFLNDLNKFVTIIEPLENINNYKQHVNLDYLEDIYIYVDKLKKSLLSSYIESFFSISWLVNLNRSLVLPLDKKWIIVIFYFKRFSYSKIGNALLDKLSRERIRQIIKTFQKNLRIKLVLPSNDFDNELLSVNIKNDNEINTKSEYINSKFKEDLSQKESIFKLDFAKLEQAKLEQKKTDERLSEIYSISYDDESEIEEEENLENSKNNDNQVENKNDSDKLVYKSYYQALIKFIVDNIDDEEAINNSLNEEEFLEEINNFCYEEFNDLLLEEDEDIFYLTKEVFENFKISFNSND